MKTEIKCPAVDRAETVKAWVAEAAAKALEPKTVAELVAETEERAINVEWRAERAERAAEAAEWFGRAGICPR